MTPTRALFENILQEILDSEGGEINYYKRWIEYKENQYKYLRGTILSNNLEEHEALFGKQYRSLKEICDDIFLNYNQVHGMCLKGQDFVEKEYKLFSSLTSHHLFQSLLNMNFIVFLK